MPIVTIKIHNKEFQLSCEQGGQNKIMELAETINSKLKAMAQLNPYASCELLLVMLVLSLMDDHQETKVHSASKGFEEDSNKFFQQQLLTIFSELQTLNKKI